MSRQDDHADYYDLEQEEDDLEDDEEYMEIRDDDLRKDIKGIENPITREEELEKVKKIYTDEKELRSRLDREEINLDTYDAIHMEKIKPILRKAKSRCGLASVGLSSDDIGDMTEDLEHLYKDDTRMAEIKDRIKEEISIIGPDAAQERADRLHEEEDLSKDAHDRISRQIRIHRRKNE